MPSARSNAFCASGVHEVLNSTLPSCSPLDLPGEAASSWWARAPVAHMPTMRLTVSIRRVSFMMDLQGEDWPACALVGRRLRLEHAVVVTVSVVQRRYTYPGTAQGRCVSFRLRIVIVQGHHSIAACVESKEMGRRQKP